MLFTAAAFFFAKISLHEDWLRVLVTAEALGFDRVALFGEGLRVLITAAAFFFAKITLLEDWLWVLVTAEA